MKRILKAFVAWLDRKFPDKIILTVEEFTKLKEGHMGLALTLQAFTKDEVKRAQETEKLLLGFDERLKKVESEINKFNAAFGFGGNTLIPKGMAVPFQR